MKTNPIQQALKFNAFMPWSKAHITAAFGVMILVSSLSNSALISPAGAQTTTVGQWKFDGHTTAEENEGAGETYSASVKFPYNGEELFLTLSCYIKDKSISFSVGGREKFEKTARAAIKATKGRFSKEASHVDLVFDGQSYPAKASVYDINGELGFEDNHKPNGHIINGFMRAKQGWINAPGLQVSVPLKNSANAICQTLKKCGVPQAYCQSTGR